MNIALKLVLRSNATSEMQYSFVISAKTSFAKAVLLEPHILVVVFAMHRLLHQEILQDFSNLETPSTFEDRLHSRGRRQNHRRTWVSS